MKTLTAILFCFAACGVFAEAPIILKTQGSFAVGGKVLRDCDGRTFHGDHAYVFYQIPEKARKYPLVFAHGVGQFSKTWETTPDGRDGFQNIFLRRNFSVYLVDQSRRGNAGRSTQSATITPAFDEEVWFNRFRIGIYPNYFDGVRFDKGAETLSQFFRQMTPNVGSVDFDVYSDVYAALFEKIGGWSVCCTFAGRRGRVADAPEDGQNKGNRRLRARRERPVPRWESPARGEDFDAFEEDGRRGGFARSFREVCKNSHNNFLRRQSARERRTPRVVRMDAAS